MDILAESILTFRQGHSHKKTVFLILGGDINQIVSIVSIVSIVLQAIVTDAAQTTPCI